MRNGVPGSAIRAAAWVSKTCRSPPPTRSPSGLTAVFDIAVSGRPLMSDKDYCAALARKWRTYTRTDASGPAPQAIAQCEAGNYDAGITTLETILTDDRIVLPSRYL